MIPLLSKTFLEGPAGAGKTTLGVERMLTLLNNGIPGNEILVLLPQRTLATPYENALRNPHLGAGGQVTISTVGGLTQRMVELFWPLVAEEAGFAHPENPPIFLNLETAQYHMARIVRPLIENEGYFESVTLDRNRIYSQILDNLGKAAVIGFPYTEIGARLAASWIGEGEQIRVYSDAQESANAFRAYCLAHNLLDFSLWFETFRDFIWPNPLCRDHLTGQYRHLIYDNVEEDHPAAHDLLRDWLPLCTSALLLYDTDAGYRRFLAADPDTAFTLRHLCDDYLTLETSHVIPPALETFRQRLTTNHLTDQPINQSPITDPQSPTSNLHYSSHRFYPQLLNWVAEEIQRLVQEDGIPPGQIVVLAPYLSDALRFSLMNRLEGVGIPVQSHRPSRSLREEPAALCLLTLAALAHPQWGLPPAPFDVAYALRQALDGLDLIRAQLLAETLYRPQTGAILRPFEDLAPDMQQRITYVIGERYERLRSWLEKYTVNPPDTFDFFLNRLFGERLSQPGYRFHRDLDSGKVVANLIDSVRNFRWVVGDQIEAEGGSVGKEYLQMVRDGLLASQYVASWDTQTSDAVLLAPAYTFLMSNRPVDVQFWLNVSSSGWYERLYQPLTHPYVLSRHWKPGRIWTDDDEVRTSQETLNRLLTGLLRRCRQKVYLGLSDLDEHGFDQKGTLLKAINRAMKG
ncbi:MAG: recombinase family protein [Anaerolineales bacterium]